MTSSILGTDTQSGQRIDVAKSSRLQGLYIIGAPGQGKTGLIENLIVQDIAQGLGVALLDPHGDLTQAVLARLPPDREKDVILLDIADEDFPFGLNIFTCDNPKSTKAVQYVVDQVMHIFEKLFDVSRSTPRIAQYLRNCTYTLVANPGYTLVDIPLLLLDDECRKKLVANVVDTNVNLFWKVYEKLKLSEQLEQTESTRNKLEEFLQPLARNIIGQSVSTIDFRKIMDERKILLVKLNARLPLLTDLIGSIIIALILNAAYSRADIDINKRKQFHIYADEFQRFATEDFATLLTEARKFGIGTTIAHQMREQLDSQNKGATLNVANLVVFKISGQDSQELTAEFDCTPPASEIIGEEPLRAPTFDPIGYLLKNGHSEQSVMDLITLIQRIQSHLQDNTINPYVPDWEELKEDRIKRGLIRHQADLDRLRQEHQAHVRKEEKRAQNVADQIKAVFRSALDGLNKYVYQEMTASGTTIIVIPLNLLENLEVLGWVRLLTHKDTRGRTAIQVSNNPLLESALTRGPNPLAEKKFLADTFVKAHQTMRYPYYKDIEIFDGIVTPAEEKIRSDVSELVKFVDLLRRVGRILRKQPIMVNTGQYKPRYGSQRTYQDMQNEIASKLANLPKFTARIKIIGVDGKPIEYTIATAPPDKRIGKQALQERLERIQNNNINEEYIRGRQAIEDEINQRQLQSQQPLPQHSIQSRRIPICQKCGAQAVSDAIFCTQCGQKL